jgi:hypothetical protein
MNRLFRAALAMLLAGAAVIASWADEKPASGGRDEVAKRCVSLALEAELAGDQQKREKFLHMALITTPHCEAAHWGLGKVAHDGQWLSRNEVQARAASDPMLAAYDAERTAARSDKQPELRLARWCAKNGMPDRSRIHYRRVLASSVQDTRLVEEAAKALDLQYADGQWLGREEIAEKKARAKLIQAAIDKWRPTLEKLRERIASDRAKAASSAREELLAIDDPRVVFVVDTFLVDSGDAFGEAAIELLGKFPDYEASVSIVKFAVLSPSQTVRSAAITSLRSRPWHHSAPLLINALTAPVKSQYSIVHDENVGNVSYEHVLLQEGADSNLLMSYRHQIQTYYDYALARPAAPGLSDRETNVLLYGSPNVSFTHHAAAQAIDDFVTATNLEKAVSRHNDQAARANAPIYAALEGISDQDVPRDPVAWRQWWLQHNEVYSPPPTTFVFQQKNVVVPGLISMPISCFQRGVKVWTEKGLASIEEVQVGDRVYSQDPQSGELALKLVTQTPFGAPRAPLVRLTVAGEELFPTLGHDIWKNGAGWQMAKELAVGDRLHGINGSLQVEGVETLPAPPQVYNLIVEDFNTYFVGERGVLVHDMSFRRPTTAITPGLVATAK